MLPSLTCCELTVRVANWHLIDLLLKGRFRPSSASQIDHTPNDDFAESLEILAYNEISGDLHDLVDLHCTTWTTDCDATDVLASANVTVPLLNNRRCCYTLVQ